MRANIKDRHKRFLTVDSLGLVCRVLGHHSSVGGGAERVASKCSSKVKMGKSVSMRHHLGRCGL